MQASFETKIRKTDTCWIWLGTIDRDGYGKYGNKFAHRLSYEYYIGPIPEGMQIDHVVANGCTRRDCVNPEHLEAVTPAENGKRQSRNNQYRGVTHCKHEHEFDEANTIYTYDGRRQCRACRDERMKKWYAKQKSIS